MPSFVKQALLRSKQMAAYRSRPPYQQNDYLSWIARAKLEATRHKRLEQMLEELARGDVYMKMPWRAQSVRAPPRRARAARKPSSP